MPCRTFAGIAREECGTWRITGDSGAPGRSWKEDDASFMGTVLAVKCRGSYVERQARLPPGLGHDGCAA
jgi:hypothetical protein